MWDWVLWGILAAFWIWEAVAHFVLHNAEGHTLSNRIQLFEKLTGWRGHVVVGVLVVLLFIHLEV